MGRRQLLLCFSKRRPIQGRSGFINGRLRGRHLGLGSTDGLVGLVRRRLGGFSLRRRTIRGRLGLLDDRCLSTHGRLRGIDIGRRRLL